MYPAPGDQPETATLGFSSPCFPRQARELKAVVQIKLCGVGRVLGPSSAASHPHCPGGFSTLLLWESLLGWCLMAALPVGPTISPGDWISSIIFSSPTRTSQTPSPVYLACRTFSPGSMVCLWELTAYSCTHWLLACGKVLKTLCDCSVTPTSPTAIGF